jgi:hypothetical protein
MAVDGSRHNVQLRVGDAVVHSGAEVEHPPR